MRKNFPGSNATLLPGFLGLWCTVEVVKQVKDGEYVYTVHIDGAEIGSTKNPNPAEFSDVFIYASDPWYLAQPSRVRAVTIETILVITAYIFTFYFSNN